jgi:hypothetical protein
VYDMYPWDESAAAESPSHADPAMARAVQFALDRRDNGGDAPGVAGQATPSPARQ